jgi:hypothetical protein
MVIAEGKNVKIGVWDIETLKELFDIGVYDPDTKEWIEFQVSKYRNDLFSIIKLYQDSPFDYWVSFNGINFDHQVMEFIVKNYEKWIDFEPLQITGKIHDFVQRMIDDQNYGITPPFKESNFLCKPIDVFRIHHFNNEARRVSLKWCEFMMNMDVEEMPIHHSKTELTEEEISQIQSYRRKDVLATLALFYITLGQVDKVSEIVFETTFIKQNLKELSDYLGKNKIQDRFDVIEETGMNCLNWDDVKIGEEWNKLNYKEIEKIKDDNQLFSRKIVYPFGKKFKNYFPKSMDFQTEKYKNFIENIGNQYVKNEKQEFKIKIQDLYHTFAKGGIHVMSSNRKIICPNRWILRDCDVGGQYPNFIIKEKIHPPSLKPTIITIASQNVEKRTYYKKAAQELEKSGEDKVKARKYKGLQEMLKLCNNGGLFGKLGQEGSFLHYPEGLLRVCIGNEIEILMLMEMFELNNFNIIASNTDGLVVMFPKEKEEEYFEICNWWENKVGNIKGGKLEFTDFEEIYEESVNHYIGKKLDGECKKKGRFVTNFELYKNKSARIIPLALEEYFINKKDPIRFITEHKNIFDFCIAKKATGQMYYEEIISEKEVKTHKKLIRYFVSENGNVFKKRGLNSKDDEVDAYCEAPNKDFPWLGEPKLTYFNKAFLSDNYKIDYKYYIIKVLERIDNIEKTNKAKKYAEKFKPNIQGSLF